jgi:hypothetical protein
VRAYLKRREEEAAALRAIEAERPRVLFLPFRG